MPFNLSDSDRVGKIFGFSLLKGNVLVFLLSIFKVGLGVFKVVPEPSIYFTGTCKAGYNLRLILYQTGIQ